MKLIGPWYSGYTRRVGISLRLLDLAFEHLPYHAYQQQDLIRPYSPMIRVPALVLDTGATLIDSSAIVDYLDTMVDPQRRLLPLSGHDRQRALRIVGYAMACFEKLSRFCDEDLRPDQLRIRHLQMGYAEQLRAGLDVLEREDGLPWFLGERLSQADVMTIVSFQGAAFILPELFNQKTYPRLSARAERAMDLDAFSSTFPSLT